MDERLEICHRALQCRNKRLSRHINDCGWGMLDNFIKYKIEANGGYFIKVDTFYPSSKTCSCCGYVNSETKDLSVREWICPNCNSKLDRDINAAKNILQEGLRLLNA